MAARRLTAAQARDRRSKRAAIGLGVVLIGVAVIQGPKLMKQLSPPAAPADPAAVATAGSTTGATDTGSTGTTSSSASSGSTSAAPAGTQLQSFSLLAAKDPFHALVQPTDAATSATTAATTTTPATTTPATTSPTTTTPAPTTKAVGFTVAPPNAALLKTNGNKQVVVVGDAFPKTQPLFKVVALGKKGVRIGVLSGSFTSGIPTLLLRMGHRVTLANQSDGTHYVIQFVRLTTAAVTADPTTTATPATTPTTTTPVTTTPVATTPVTTTPSATPPAAG
jgi:hypothetical protein